MKPLNIFIILISCNVVCNLAMSIIAPFYPQFAESKDISEDLIGIIFAAHPLGQFIASLILGKLIQPENRTTIITIGVILLGLGLFFFGMLNYIEQRIYIIFGSLLARLTGGVGASMFMTPFYAFIPQLFPKSIEEKIALAEVSTSLGFLCGPILGSALYSLGGFVLPFFVFACLSFCLAVILFIYAGSLNMPETDLHDQIILHRSIQNESVVELDFKISYLKLLTNYPVVISFFMNTLTLSVWTFYNPTLALYLYKQYDVPEKYSGYWISINAAAFGIATLFISKVKKQKKFFMYYGFVISGILQFFMGPDYTFTRLSPKLAYTVSTWSIIGFTAGFPYVLALPEINQILQRDYYKYPTQCANIASAIFNASLAGGELFGPIAGGYLAKWYGFARAGSILGGLVLFLSACYVPYLFMEDKIKKKQSNKVKSEND